MNNNNLRQVRFWSVVFLLGGIAFLLGSLSLFTLSRQPIYGFYQLACAIIFFGVFAYFRRHIAKNAK
jgi:hypothetical protein